jgi:hypothetical protein
LRIWLANSWERFRFQRYAVSWSFPLNSSNMQRRPVELSWATLTLLCGLLQARAFYGFQIAIENIHSGVSVWGLLPYEVSIYGIQTLHFRVVCICVIT